MKKFSCAFNNFKQCYWKTATGSTKMFVTPNVHSGVFFTIKKTELAKASKRIVLIEGFTIEGSPQFVYITNLITKQS